MPDVPSFGTYVTVIDLPGRNKGCVACRDIQAGTTIYDEPPLLSISKRNETRKAIAEAVHALSNDDRQKYKSLCNAFPAYDEDEGYGVFRTNSILMGESGRAGVFHKISRINSSCRPNCIASWNSSRGTLRIRSCVKIRLGDEITFCYIWPLANTAMRRAELMERYRFLCKCSACQADPGIQLQSDQRRQRLEEIGHELQSAIPLDIVAISEEALALMQAEQIYGPRYLFSQKAYYASIAVGDEETISQWSKHVSDQATLAFGEDDARTCEALELAKFHNNSL